MSDIQTSPPKIKNLRNKRQDSLDKSNCNNLIINESFIANINNTSLPEGENNNIELVTVKMIDPPVKNIATLVEIKNKQTEDETELNNLDESLNVSSIFDVKVNSTMNENDSNEKPKQSIIKVKIIVPKGTLNYEINDSTTQCTIKEDRPRSPSPIPLEKAPKVREVKKESSPRRYGHSVPIMGRAALMQKMQRPVDVATFNDSKIISDLVTERFVVNAFRNSTLQRSSKAPSRHNRLYRSLNTISNKKNNEDSRILRVPENSPIKLTDQVVSAEVKRMATFRSPTGREEPVEVLNKEEENPQENEVNEAQKIVILSSSDMEIQENENESSHEINLRRKDVNQIIFIPEQSSTKTTSSDTTVTPNPVDDTPKEADYKNFLPVVTLPEKNAQSMIRSSSEVNIQVNNRCPAINVTYKKNISKSELDFLSPISSPLECSFPNSASTVPLTEKNSCYSSHCSSLLEDVPYFTAVGELPSIDSLPTFNEMPETVAQNGTAEDKKLEVTGETELSSYDMEEFLKRALGDELLEDSMNQVRKKSFVVPYVPFLLSSFDNSFLFSVLEHIFCVVVFSW